MTMFYLAAHALVSKDGKYLVTRRSAINDYMPLKWDIPGGFVEAGESVEQALSRELTEETKLIIEVKRPLFIYPNLSQLPEKQVFQVVYLCDYLSGDVSTDPEEHDYFQWLELNKMRELDTIAFLSSFLSNIPEGIVL